MPGPFVFWLYLYPIAQDQALQRKQHQIIRKICQHGEPGPEESAYSVTLLDHDILSFFSLPAPAFYSTECKKINNLCTDFKLIQFSSSWC